jgi:fructosamine-3-kinase
MKAALADRIAALLGRRALKAEPLGGAFAPVLRIDLEGGERLVAKTPPPGRSLAVEAWMLGELKAKTELPVPAVIAAAPDLLLMEFIEISGPLDARAEEHAAQLLAALHAAPAGDFGLERDTVIGALDQPNAPSRSWIEFFRDRRLLHRARRAQEAGRLPASLRRRIETLAGRLERWLAEPPHAALIHGDVWDGNVLVRDGRVAAFVDPAIYRADPEIELAFATLFNTFGDAFFGLYEEIRPLPPGFHEERRHLYNLYPLLVHAELFGGGYVAAIERTLGRFGV